MAPLAPAFSIAELAASARVPPALDSVLSKGAAGCIAVVGGNHQYTGAPYFAAKSALNAGADLSHVVCSPGAAVVIKGYSPDLIVHPKLGSHEADAEAMLLESKKWARRATALVVGPGLGRDDDTVAPATAILLDAAARKQPLVIDADGIGIVAHNEEVSSSLKGHKWAVLTPNVNEQRRLCSRFLGKQYNSSSSARDAASRPSVEDLRELTDVLDGPMVLAKGQQDIILWPGCEGGVVIERAGSRKRCGGIGDILSGLSATCLSWCYDQRSGAHAAADDGLLLLPPQAAAVGVASHVTRHASRLAFEKHGRSTLASDILEYVGSAMDHFFPVGADS